MKCTSGRSKHYFLFYLMKLFHASVSIFSPSFVNFDSNMVLNYTNTILYKHIFWRLCLNLLNSILLHLQEVVSLAFRTEACLKPENRFCSPNPNYFLFSFLNLNFSSKTPSGPLTVSKSPKLSEKRL